MNKAKDEAKLIDIKITQFKYNWHPGTTESVLFHLAFNPEYYDGFNNDLVKQIVLYKWSLLWKYKLAESIFLLAFMIALIGVSYLNWMVVAVWSAIFSGLGLVRELQKKKLNPDYKMSNN